MYRSILAQYLPDDENDPEYEERMRGEAKFKLRLEHDHPQICEDCLPRVEARLRNAKYTANSDNLRRLMDKTRARQKRKRTFGWLQFFSTLGKFGTYFGLVGQLIWNGLGIFGSQSHRFVPSLLPIPPSTLFGFAHFFRTIRFFVLSLLPLPQHEGVPIQATYALLISLGSIWWNPRFRDTIRCFDVHMSGRRQYYTSQVILLVVRSLFRSLLKRGILGNVDSSGSRAVHLAMLAFTTIVRSQFELSTNCTNMYDQNAYQASKCIKIDQTRLFSSTQTDLREYVKKNSSPRSAPNDLASILDDIASTTRQPAVAETPSRHLPSLPSLGTQLSPSKLPIHDTPQMTPSWKTPITSRQALLSSPAYTSPSRNSPRSPGFRPHLTSMTNRQSLHWMRTGEYPPGVQPPLEEAIDQEDSMDQMEWEPIQPIQHSVSKYRAFNPDRSAASRSSQLFGQAPTRPEPEASPFWFKVPSAPVNKTLQKEVNKRNPSTQHFFNGLNRSPALSEPSLQPSPIEKPEVNFAPPRFHPPQQDSYVGDGLADVLSSFSLGPSEREQEKEVLWQKEKERHAQALRANKRYGTTAMVLMVLFFIWNYILSNDPSSSLSDDVFDVPTDLPEHIRPAILGTMVATALIALRLMADTIMKKSLREQIMTCLAGGQIVVIAYIGNKIWVEIGEWEVWQALGSLVMLVSFVQHTVMASFQDTVYRTPK